MAQPANSASRALLERRVIVRCAVTEGMGRLTKEEKSAVHSACRTNRYRERRNGFMLMTLAIVLIVLWLLGMVTSYTMGGIIHVLLVIAIVVFLVQVIQGRRLR
jgi:hypothetical protein